MNHQMSARRGFLEELSMPRPDPGGGAAAAYGGSLALALLEKIVRLELGRFGPHPEASEARRLWERLLETVESLKIDMEKLRGEDVEAYAKLSRALASPKRRAELPSAFEEAMGCPARIIEKAGESLAAVGEAGSHCKKHLVADLQVACEFLEAAAKGAYGIARANLHLVKDAPDPARHEASLAEARKRCEAQYLRTSRELAARLGSEDVTGRSK